MTIHGVSREVREAILEVCAQAMRDAQRASQEAAASGDWELVHDLVFYADGVASVWGDLEAALMKLGPRA